MEAVSKELTGIVCLEREAGCMQSALQLVETSAQTIEREGVSEVRDRGGGGELVGVASGPSRSAGGDGRETARAVEGGL